MQPWPDVFDRAQERQELRLRLRQRRGFLFHGESGAGKTLLLRSLCQEFPKLICCQAGNGIQQLCLRLALSLLETGNRTIRGKLGDKPGEKLQSMRSVSLRGIIAEALAEEPYLLVLDQCGFASQQLASMIKSWFVASLPVVVVSRSVHMEAIGYVASLFPDRKDKLLLGNFSSVTALSFADWESEKRRLEAENLAEFKLRIVELTRGNPGMISKLMQLAALPQYRSVSTLKLCPSTSISDFMEMPSITPSEQSASQTQRCRLRDFGC